MKKVIIAALLSLIVCFLVSCGSEYDKDYVYDGESLLGRWQEVDYDERLYKIYEFKNDGTVTFRYYTYGIVYSDSYGTRTQEYRTEGTNTLILVEEFNGKKIDTEFKFSINKDGRLVMHADDTDVNVLEPYDLGYDIGNESPVVGKWMNKTDSGNNLFWFRETGACIIYYNMTGTVPDKIEDMDTDPSINFDLVGSMLYSTKGDKINVLFSDKYEVAYQNVGRGNYEINGNKLIISTDKGSFELERCE